MPRATVQQYRAARQGRMRRSVSRKSQWSTWGLPSQRASRGGPIPIMAYHGRDRRNIRPDPGECDTGGTMPQVSNRPVVEVLDRAADRPVLARVGVIALVGFAVGIVWPRLAGVRLGPAPPEDERGALAALTSASSSAQPTVSASASDMSLAAPSHSAAVPANGQTVVVGAGKVLSCRNTKGKSPDECDTPSFDALAVPKLRSLAKCPASSGLSGKLSVGIDLDFHRNRIKLARGKSTTLSKAAVAALWPCLEAEFQKTKLDDLAHQHARYAVFYTVQFFPPGKMPEGEVGGERTEAGGQNEKKPSEQPSASAQVVYDTVLVRDEPGEGKVIGRLVRGTRVELLFRKGGWYRIRIGDREGWVYRGSIAQ